MKKENEKDVFKNLFGLNGLRTTSWIWLNHIHFFFLGESTKGTFGTLNEDYDKNCNLYY